MTTPSEPGGARITRDDIEAKFRQLRGGVEESVDGARASLKPVGIAAAIVLLILVYLLGRRAGRKRGQIVEIKYF